MVVEEQIENFSWGKTISLTIKGFDITKKVMEYQRDGFKHNGTNLFMDSNYEIVWLYKEIINPVVAPIEENKDFFDEDDCFCHIIAPCAGCEIKSAIEKT